MNKIIFLDFDGVLHPEDVRLIRGQPVLMPDGHDLFEHAAILADHLAPQDDINIVLSTSWAMQKGFDYATSRLPESLQKKVIGSTFHSSMKAFWMASTRHQQIVWYVRRHNISHWLALDDDDWGWPDDLRHRLVKCDEYGGIGEVLDDFVEKLERL